MMRPPAALLRPLKTAAVATFGAEAALSRRWAAGAHRRLRRAQWSIPPAPDNFDHFIDLYANWTASGDADWLLRGVASSLCLRGGRLLELSCGDGFNARHFYAGRCREVVACDIDDTALEHAARRNAAPNVTYRHHDVRTPIADGPFDNIVWDFAYPFVRFFDDAELDEIFSNIKAATAPDGIFSGYTLAEDTDPTGTVFQTMEQLRGYLTPHFANVKLFQVDSPPRRHLHFWASDGALPFDPAWPDSLVMPVSSTGPDTSE